MDKEEGWQGFGNGTLYSDKKKSLCEFVGVEPIDYLCKELMMRWLGWNNDEEALYAHIYIYINIYIGSSKLDTGASDSRVTGGSVWHAQKYSTRSYI